MFPFIVCFCGRSSAELYDLFIALRRERYEEYISKNNIVVKGDYIKSTNQIPIELGDILDDLNLKLACCRTRMLCQVMFNDLY
jgi:DNA-directed RNA polymerase subunit N (RpoN/RPB10)